MLNIKALQRMAALSSNESAGEYLSQVDMTEHLDELSKKLKSIGV